jgi:ubiquinone/menaquinone biosynthesis C-methylase UbiE
MDRMHGHGQGHQQRQIHNTPRDGVGHRHDHVQDHGQPQEHGHAHGPGSEHGQSNEHGHAGAPTTQGRLIRWAWLYDPVVWLMSAGQSRALRTLPLELAAIRPGEDVLDVGCGTGDLTLRAARQAAPTGKVYGIDAAPEMIAEANRKAKRAKANVQFMVEPVEALSFPDGSFDVALSSLVMHHLPGDLKRSALTEVRRVLRPGGRVVIVDFQPTAGQPSIWQPGGLAARVHKHQTPTAEQVQAGLAPLAVLLRDAGFADVKNGSTRYPWLGYVVGRVPE